MRTRPRTSAYRKREVQRLWVHEFILFDRDRVHGLLGPKTWVGFTLVVEDWVPRGRSDQEQVTGQPTYLKISSRWSWVAATPCMFDIYWRMKRKQPTFSQVKSTHTVIGRIFSIRASSSRRVVSGSARRFVARTGPRDSCKPTSWDLVFVSIFAPVHICWLRSSLSFWLLSQHVLRTAVIDVAVVMSLVHTAAVSFGK